MVARADLAEVLDRMKPEVLLTVGAGDRPHCLTYVIRRHRRVACEQNSRTCRHGVVDIHLHRHSERTNYLLDETSPYAVIEADEYDRSFHHLHPSVAVVTSTDPDHLDIYGTEESSRFTGDTSEDLCALDDLKSVLPEPRQPRMTLRYGRGIDHQRVGWIAEIIRNKGRFVGI